MGGYLSNQKQVNPQEILIQLENTRIERELAIAELIAKRRKLYELAKEREQLNWAGSGGLVTTVLTALSSYHHRNLLHLLPIVPIATYLGYKAHLCYGDKNKVINEAAYNLMESEKNTSFPTPLSVADVRARIDELRMLKTEDEFFN